MAISDYYTQSVNRLTFTAGSTDPFSTSTGVWAVADTFDAAVDIVSGRERYIGDQSQVLADYTMYCNKDTDLVAGGRVRWDGQDLRIIEKPRDVLQRGHHYEVLLRKTDVER